MAWTKCHMASTTEKCGRAKFTSSHSSKGCLVCTNLTWMFLNFINNIHQRRGDNYSWWGPPQASFLPLLRSQESRDQFSCVVNPSQSTAIPSDFWHERTPSFSNSIREDALFPLFWYNINYNQVVRIKFQHGINIGREFIWEAVGSISKLANQLETKFKRHIWWLGTKS